MGAVAAGVADRASPRTQPEAERPALRFLTCGSVDDGKSTLMGRLLHEQGVVPDDQMTALRRDTARHASASAETADGAIDFALLVDGLDAEREQGITIDVAYRYFRTPSRSFVAIDAPGHEQYTRNMATGASNADLAVLLVDARKGLLSQTRRHAIIASMLGIHHVVLAVNKIDLVGHDRRVFEAILTAFQGFARALEFHDVTAIPLSARYGDNISAPSTKMPWYEGPSLVEHLESVDIVDNRSTRPFRMPVQWINRSHDDFRGIAGTVSSGHVATGDEIVVAETGRSAVIARILAPDGDSERAVAGDAVTLTLDRAIDVARGDVLAKPDARPEVADRFSARLVWMSDEPLRLAFGYLLKIGARTVPATVVALEHRFDIATACAEPAATLQLNEVGLATIATTAPIAFDPYVLDRTTGGLILIDRISNETMAAGMVVRGLRAASNVYPQDFMVTRADRARLKGHRPGVVWLTGLPSAGKSTIANQVEARLNRAGVHTAMLDGDNLRLGLTKDLGFSSADRTENIRRVAEVARLMTDAGLVVLCSFVSPLRAERAMARATMLEAEFFEVFVDTPLATCVERDPKGLYRRAIVGEIKDFTGVDQPYEAPIHPDLVVGRDGETIEHAVAVVMEVLQKRGLLDPFDNVRTI